MPARWCTTRKLIILDEPLTGLDAGSARQVKNVLRERVAAGGTVIMTTHILEVAERMADRIGVIAGGRLIAEGTLDELRHQTGQTAITPGRHLPHAGRRASRSRVSQPAHIALARRPRIAARLARLAVADDGRPPAARAHRRDRASSSSPLFMHLFAWSIVEGYADANVADDAATLVGVTGTLLLSWSLMLSQAMESVTRAFYARSDLDLILSSPVSARKVFAVRIGAHRAASVA